MKLDHFEEMNESNIEQKTMDPARDQSGINASANNESDHDKKNIQKRWRVELPFDIDGALMELDIGAVFLNILLNADTCSDKEKHNKHFCEQIEYGSNKTE